MTRPRDTSKCWHPQGWKRLATAAVVSSCCSAVGHAFVCGPLHKGTTSNSRLGLMLDVPSCLGDTTKTMFLNPSQLQCTSPLLTNTRERYYGGYAISKNSQQEGMLGFDATALQQPYPTSPIKNQLASSIWKRQESSLLPAWFPWLPSPSQIQILKVIELREACAERSLKRSGKKAELQQRLMEWTRLQHEQRIHNANASPLGTAIDMSLHVLYGKSSPPPRPRVSPSRSNFRYNSKPNHVSKQTKGTTRTTPNNDNKTKQPQEKKSRQPDSLEDWARNVNVEALLKRRGDIRRQALEGKRKRVEKNLEDTSVFKRAPTKKDVDSLAHAFEKPPSLYSNLQVQQMYKAAKQADQEGNRSLSKRLLLQLKEATPHDARIFRRLARMETQDGRVHEARKLLQEGLRRHAHNAYLWHGLGQLEWSAKNYKQAKGCFQKAIASDPTLPHAHHALGTMEHSHGRIAAAMCVLKEGIRYCPTNHRLYHALGDLYREAKLLEMAETCYRKSLELGDLVNHGFAYTALAYVAYEKRSMDECRHWLREATCLNLGRNSRSWVAWGQMEEAEGDIDAARAVYVEALAKYESGLIHRHLRRHKQRHGGSSLNDSGFRNNVAWGGQRMDLDDKKPATPRSLNDSSFRNNGGQRMDLDDKEPATPRSLNDSSFRNNGAWGGQRINLEDKKPATPRSLNDSSFRGQGMDLDDKEPATPRHDVSKNMETGDKLTSLKEKLLKRVPSYRSGDKFVNVYRNWARLEERYGNEQAVNAVYARATAAFSRDYQLSLKWARYNARIGNLDKARTLFQDACKKANNWHADPYRQYGELEMSLGNYSKARSILYRGAQVLSYSSDGGLGNRGGMAQLFHTWAVCEWYLDNLSRAEVLFDHALRLTNGGPDGSKIRSYILYSIARLEYFRGEYELAQHFLGLCLKDNVMPGGNSKTWALWADIANAMGNDSLAEKCARQAEITRKDEENGGVESLSRLLGMTRPKTASSSLQNRNNGATSMQHLMRRDPWNHKIFGQSSVMGGFDGVKFPDELNESRE